MKATAPRIGLPLAGRGTAGVVLLLALVGLYWVFRGFSGLPVF